MANGVRGVLSRFRVLVNDQDISPAIAPILLRLSVRDEAGGVSDTASIDLDDSAGVIVFPSAGARMRVELKAQDALGLVFDGTVDEARSKGGRSEGRILSISAKGANVLGRAKQLQTRHFDGATIAQALQAAGLSAGVADVRVDPDLGSQVRSYIAMEGESFLAFGQRIAREVGGTFKVAGDRAMLVRRNGGTAASGRPLDVVEAVWGRNLISWDMVPRSGRPRHRRAVARHYDPARAMLVEASADVGDDSTDAEHFGRFVAADADEAAGQAGAAASEISRAGGAGTVEIDGDTRAKSEATCRIVGARPGVDGEYRIDAAEHTLDRAGGLVTRLELGQPRGEAGKDRRKKASPLATMTFEER